MAAPEDRRGFSSYWYIFVIAAVVLVGTAAVIGGWFEGVSFTATATPTCLEEKNGVIDVVITDKNGPHTIKLTGPGGFKLLTASTHTPDLPRGTYQVTVTNAKGVSSAKDVTIDGSGKPVLEVAQAPTDLNTADGALRVSIKPACTGCTYTWPDGRDEPLHQGLAAGPYTVTVTSSSPPCSRELWVKLLPSTPPCATWAGTTTKVRSLGEWSFVPGVSPPMYGYKMEVAKYLLDRGGAVHLGDCERTISFDDAQKMLMYLHKHGGPDPISAQLLNPGDLLDPVFDAKTTRNDLAAELFALDLNIHNVDELGLPPSPPMKDAVYLGTPYHGRSVSQIKAIAEHALGCGADMDGVPLNNAQFADLLKVLVAINDEGRYLACAP